MKKYKKFIYPFILSLCFFVVYMIVAIVLNLVLPSDDYAGLAYAGIALLIWVAIILPIYCYKYGKMILQEKHKRLFGFYNPLVVTLCHTGPFLFPAISGSDFGVIFGITVGLFIWTAMWTFAPLSSIQEQDDNHSAETQESCETCDFEN